MADSVDIPNRGPQLQSVCITLVTLAVTATLLRCYTRIFIMKSFGLDDGIMVIATISFILFTACALIGVHYGTGRHHRDLEPENIQEAMKFWWFCYIWYCITMIASKVSIGIFLLRITVVKIHQWIIYSLLLLSVASGIVFFFVTLLQCQPLYYFWDKNDPGSCIPPSVIAALTYLYSAVSVICDFTFALLPLHMIMGLQMRRSLKLALIPILGMACVASVAVAVRFVYIHKFTDPDFLWATLDIAIWSDTEQGLAICAGCLATLQPLIKRGAQSLGFWTTHTEIGVSGSNGKPIPPTIGSVDKYKSVRSPGAHNGNFTMATFQRVSEDDDEHLDLEGHNLRGESKTGVITASTHAAGNSGRNSDGDDSKNTHGIVYTKSFKVEKEPAHNNNNNNNKNKNNDDGMYRQSNDSEDRLTNKSSKDMMEEGGPRVIPRSPLDSEPPSKRV